MQEFSRSRCCSFVLCCHYGGSKRLSYASYVSSVPEDTSNITYIKFYRAKLF